MAGSATAFDAAGIALVDGGPGVTRVAPSAMHRNVEPRQSGLIDRRQVGRRGCRIAAATRGLVKHQQNMAHPHGGRSSAINSPITRGIKPQQSLSAPVKTATRRHFEATLPHRRRSGETALGGGAGFQYPARRGFIARQ
jgi:hypothetical protein